MSYRERLHKIAAAARRAVAAERGLTLIESLVAVSLVTLSAAGIGSLLTHQIRQASNNQLATKAYSLAAEELERMRGRPYALMQNTSRNETVGGVVLTVNTTVNSDVPAANMKKITVVVSWSEPQGNRNVAISTVYTAVQRS